MYFALLIAGTCTYVHKRHLIIYQSLSVVIHYHESYEQSKVFERTAIELQTIYHTQTFFKLLPNYTWLRNLQADAWRLSCWITHSQMRGDCRAGSHIHCQIPVIQSQIRNIDTGITKNQYISDVRQIVKIRATPYYRQPYQLSSFYLCNVRSLNNKFDELYSTAVEHTFDTAAITWFKSDLPCHLVSIPSYSMFSKSRIKRITNQKMIKILIN